MQNISKNISNWTTIIQIEREDFVEHLPKIKKMIL